jgi:malonate-semialdehyde dehydrogenase (acetylating)/methylmalonate-semialdehyde dehydrogenase
MAVSVVVAVGDVADALRDRLAARANRVKVNCGTHEAADMGPVITCAARDRIMGYIDRGVEEGATLVVDGRKPRIPGYESGFFVGPTLFDHVTPQMTVYKDEIFGPVLVMVRSESLQDAIAMVNANPYANGAALFTKSGYAARRFQEEIEVGMIGVNVPIPVPMAFYSFGGWRSSLFGDLHIHGMDGVRFYTRGKAITARWPDDGSAAAGFHMPLMG